MYPPARLRRDIGGYSALRAYMEMTQSKARFANIIVLMYVQFYLFIILIDILIYLVLIINIVVNGSRVSVMFSMIVRERVLSRKTVVGD